MRALFYFLLWQHLGGINNKSAIMKQHCASEESFSSLFARIPMRRYQRKQLRQQSSRRTERKLYRVT